MLQFAGGRISKDLNDLKITHIVISASDLARLQSTLELIKRYSYPFDQIYCSQIDVIIWLATGGRRSLGL